MDILRTQNLKVYFKQQGKAIKAVDGVDVFLKEGLIVSLAGESGCGKSTLAKTILGFNKPYAGKVYFKGVDITLKKNEPVIRKNIRIVFQNPYLSFDPRYTVFAALYEALTVFKKLSKSEGRGLVVKALNEVELNEDALDRYPHELSGGQLQRVCIARALINNPSLVILDEPTSSLDATTAYKIIKLLKELRDSRAMTFLFISHNLKLLHKISDFCFIMYNGKIVEYGPKDILYANPLHPYTKLLFDSADYKIKNILQAQELDYYGCVFKGNCQRKTAACDNPPSKLEAEPGHAVFCFNVDSR